jgi:HAD superfamily hydrolase (TIGR01509 family)
VRAHHGERYPVDALMREWHGAYDALVAREGIALKPGLLDLLGWLDAEAIPKAVATSTRRTRAQAKLEQTRLAHHFAALVGGDEIPRGKPEPDIYLERAARLAVAPARCVALEDSEPGMHAALEAGMMAIMVPDLAPPSSRCSRGRRSCSPRERRARASRRAAGRPRRTSPTDDRPPHRHSRREESAAGSARRAGRRYEIDVPMSTFYNLPATASASCCSRISSCARTRICCSASATRTSGVRFASC